MALNPSALLPKRGTAAQWASANPVLGVGEVGYETDTKRSKRGDSSSAWSALPYVFDQTTADVRYATAASVATSLSSKADLVSGKVPVAQIPTLTAAAVGLGNVNNTADLDKPISTATQGALDQLAANGGGGGGTGSGVLVLGAGAAIPPGTPDGTPIFRLP